MTEYRLNAYHIMWLFVFFDLPVTTKKEIKAATLFRKNLEKDGFSMMQFSVYIRHCASRESLEVHIKRIKSILIIRKTKCFRILERNAIISKTKRNFSRLYPTPQKIKKNRPASPERNTFEGS